MKKIITMALMLLTLSAWAGDNSIYIQQSGDNSVVTMTQDGAGNTVQGVGASSNTSPAIITGNSNTVTIDQVGTGNTLDFGIDTTIANGTPLQNGNTFLYTVTGNNSTATIDSNNNGQGTSASNYVNISQTGNTSSTNANVLGTNNSITATTTGGTSNSLVMTTNGVSNTQSISVSGGGSNSVTVNQGVGGSAVPSGGTATTNNNGTADVTIVGASNTLSLQQTTTGLYQNTTVVSLNGSGNTANITQNASVANTTVNIQSTGSNNTFTIHSNAH